MKITIEHKETKIIIEETGTDKVLTTMQYSDQNRALQETIKVMCDQIIKLQLNNNQNKT